MSKLLGLIVSLAVGAGAAYMLDPSAAATAARSPATRRSRRRTG